MIIQEPIQAAIWHCLNHYDHKDAIFLAERLCLEVESDETIFILATSYYRSRQLRQTYWLLREKSRRSPQCRFLHAKCAYELKKYAEAESILSSCCFGDVKSSFDDIVKDFGEIACFALYLKAQICVKTERTQLAVMALRMALKLNPFMWQAYVDLCQLGEYPDGSSIFKIVNTDVFNTCQGNNTNAMILFNNLNICNDGNFNNTNNNNNNSNSTHPTGQLIHNNTDTAPNNHLNTSNCMFTTPIDQPIQTNNANNNNNIATHNTSISLTSPNNTSNLNNSITMLRGNNPSGLNGAKSSITNPSLNLIRLDETPLNGNANSIEASGLFGSSGAAAHLEIGAGTPFRKQFKYLSVISPTTPSFGVLPLSNNNSPYSSDTSFHGNVNAVNVQINAHVNSSPTSQTLAEVNQEQKNIVKKMKAHVNNIITRKDASTYTDSSNRPAVFTQTGNITPRRPNNNHPVVNVSSGTNVANAAVRRSSRLFCHNAYSVKENNKSQSVGNKFVQPRSPSRKTKSRMGKICRSNELIEDKTTSQHSLPDKLNERNTRRDKQKIETITLASDVSTQHRPCEDIKVQQNNAFNSTQTMQHQLLNLKKQSADGLMTLMRDLSEGYRQMVHFYSKAAIQHLETAIPKHHLSSSWVQSIIGMCYYELREFDHAAAIFKRIHEAEPYRLDFMEIYSSALWHLQQEVELSALSQDLINQDKSSAITWCVVGNCFSLQKEHETAIKFFRRAVQVDPEFVYSYTLLGHELVLTEELDKAMDCFRSAVVRDPRHYNAWFGIGTIYSKQEKFELAELHYIKALKINPHNSVILVHIGAMQYFMQKKEQALQTLNTAALLDPKDALARFHRGSIFYAMGKYQEALKELEELKEVVPKESVVFYLIGKIHKTLGNVDSALMHFSWATDLDPKGANNHVKDAFDSMSHSGCCTPPNVIVASDLEPITERSEDSSTPAVEVNYDSDF